MKTLIPILFGILLGTTAQAQTSRQITPHDVGIQTPFTTTGDVLAAGPDTSKVQDASALTTCTDALNQFGVPSCAFVRNSLFIAPPGNGTSPGLVINQSGAGAPPNLLPNASFAYNYINIIDNINGGLDLGFYVNSSVGTGATGAHYAITGAQRIDNVSADNNAGSYVALWGYSQTYSPSSGGSIYGTNPQVVVGNTATGWAAAFGEEIDIETHAAVTYVAGLDIVKFGTAGDPAGTALDTAIEIGAQPAITTNKWQYGINFGNVNGQFGLASTGSVMHTIAGTVAHGIDLSNLTCNADCFKSNGFSVGSTGDVFAPSLNASANLNLMAANQINFSAQGGSPSNNSESLIIYGGSSVVNSAWIKGGTTGNSVVYGANGTDTNVSILLQPQGTGVIKATNSLQFVTTYTVATLPTCNAGAKATLAVVTDASAPTYNATVAGSGAITIPVFCNGTNWTAH